MGPFGTELDQFQTILCKHLVRIDVAESAVSTSCSCGKHAQLPAKKEKNIFPWIDDKIK